MNAGDALAGAMLAFGGHKGSALAAMVELLAGPLIGDMTSAESLAADAGRKSSPLGGELIVAIDPIGFLGVSTNHHIRRAEALFEAITTQGRACPHNDDTKPGSEALLTACRSRVRFTKISLPC
jgi:delta1-piperideine-2-carboxylate reductase